MRGCATALAWGAPKATETLTPRKRTLYGKTYPVNPFDFFQQAFVRASIWGFAAAFVVTASVAQSVPDTAGPSERGAAYADGVRPIEDFARRQVLPQETHRTLKFRGVVTFLHASRRVFYLQDRSGGVAVSLADERLSLPVMGDEVVVTGTVEPGPLSTGFRANDIVKLGATEFPEARTISWSGAK